MEDENEESAPRTVDQHELNPSGRLYLYLVHVNSSEGINMDHCLANYLKTIRQDLPPLYSAAAEIASYPAQIRESLQQHVDTPLGPLVSAELVKVDAALAWGSVLQGDVERFRSHYDAGTMRMLEAWSGELNQRQGAVPEKATGQLAAILNALVDLQVELTNDGELDPRVRAALLRHVDAMTSSVHQFYVGGIDALLDELDRLIGSIYRDSTVTAEILRRPSWIERVATIATLVGALATGVNGLHQITPVVIDLLQLQAPTVVNEPPSAAGGHEL